MKRTPKVLTLIGDMDGCALWRCLNPITELQRQGYKGIEWGAKDDDRLALIFHQYDAVVLPRLHWPAEEEEQAARWFFTLRMAGLKIIYELDDDLISDYFVNRIIFKDGVSQEFAVGKRNSILRTIRKCDGVTVSSQRLATLLRAHDINLPIYVVPNYIDVNWFRQVMKKGERQVHGLTIGWAGGARPDADVAEMAEAWLRISRRFPNVKFVVQGHHARIIYDTVPNNRIIPLDWMPIQTYPLGMMNIDIGCCPLSDNPFNRCKTPIKAMEFALAGAAVVASPVLYSQIIEDGKNGFIARTADEWENALARLVVNYEERRRMHRNLLATVKKNHSLERNAWRWMDAWSTIIGEDILTVHPGIIIPESDNPISEFRRYRNAVS